MVAVQLYNPMDDMIEVTFVLDLCWYAPSIVVHMEVECLWRKICNVVVDTELKYSFLHNDEGYNTQFAVPEVSHYLGFL